HRCIVRVFFFLIGIFETLVSENQFPANFGQPFLAIYYLKYLVEKIFFVFNSFENLWKNLCLEVFLFVESSFCRSQAVIFNDASYLFSLRIEKMVEVVVVLAATLNIKSF
ncbi:hypothetical protein BpHYR1_020900, partial [Brachionus plicatilis]